MTKEPIIKLITYTQPKESLEAILMKAASASENKDTVRSFADFLEKCFMLDPDKRLTPQDALRNPFLALK